MTAIAERSPAGRVTTPAVTMAAALSFGMMFQISTRYS